jgi:hypothetical protein
MTKKKGKLPAPKPYTAAPNERAVIEKAIEKIKTAPRLRLKVENNVVSVDHPSPLIGSLLIKNALGSLDDGFVFGLLRQLASATSGGPNIDEDDLNFMFSVIKEIKPQDPLESMLAAQMAAVHMATMRFIQHLPLIKSLPEQDAAERAINKFARTFTTQMKALKRYRSGGEQKVTVQHVSVSEGGQAIVGNVTQNLRETASDKVPPSPPALTHSKVAPMENLGEAPRKTVPVKRKSSK